MSNTKRSTLPKIGTTLITPTHGPITITGHVDTEYGTMAKFTTGVPHKKEFSAKADGHDLSHAITPPDRHELEEMLSKLSTPLENNTKIPGNKTQDRFDHMLNYTKSTDVSKWLWVLRYSRLMSLKYPTQASYGSVVHEAERRLVALVAHVFEIEDKEARNKIQRLLDSASPKEPGSDIEALNTEVTRLKGLLRRAKEETKQAEAAGTLQTNELRRKLGEAETRAGTVSAENDRLREQVRTLQEQLAATHSQPPPTPPTPPTVAQDPIPPATPLINGLTPGAIESGWYTKGDVCLGPGTPGYSKSAWESWVRTHCPNLLPEQGSQ